MKRYSKILFSFLAVMAFALIMKMPVKAYVNPNLRQTSCTATSATFSWNKQDETTSDSSKIVSSYTLYSGNYSVTVGGGANTATLSLPYNYTGYVYLKYTYTTRYNSGNVYGPYTGYSGSAMGNTIPTTPAQGNFGITYYYSSYNQPQFAVSKPNYNFGTQLELYKGAKYVTTASFTSTYYSNITVAKNAGYKYRIRYYYTNSRNGVTYYSGWSPFRGFMASKISGKTKSNKKGITLTFKKASGCSKYQIYVSKTSSTSGFNWAKTVKAKSKKSYTAKITSKYKKKARNYLRIVPYVKIPGYSGPSDISFGGSIYVWK